MDFLACKVYRRDDHVLLIGEAGTVFYSSGGGGDYYRCKVADAKNDEYTVPGLDNMKLVLNSDDLDKYVDVDGLGRLERSELDVTHAFRIRDYLDGMMPK